MGPSPSWVPQVPHFQFRIYFLTLKMTKNNQKKLTIDPNLRKTPKNSIQKLPQPTNKPTLKPKATPQQLVEHTNYNNNLQAYNDQIVTLSCVIPETIEEVKFIETINQQIGPTAKADDDQTKLNIIENSEYSILNQKVTHISVLLNIKQRYSNTIRNKEFPLVYTSRTIPSHITSSARFFEIHEEPPFQLATAMNFEKSNTYKNKEDITASLIRAKMNPEITREITHLEYFFPTAPVNTLIIKLYVKSSNIAERICGITNPIRLDFQCDKPKNFQIIKGDRSNSEKTTINNETTNTQQLTDANTHHDTVMVNHFTLIDLVLKISHNHTNNKLIITLITLQLLQL